MARSTFLSGPCAVKGDPGFQAGLNIKYENIIIKEIPGHFNEIIDINIVSDVPLVLNLGVM